MTMSLANSLSKARRTKWFDNFDTVGLLYCSPKRETIELVEGRVGPESVSVSLGRATRKAAQVKTVVVKRMAISISCVSSIKDLQWPIGLLSTKKCQKGR